jgi:hypothetical protein
MVTCDDDLDPDDQVIANPTIIVDVVSPSSARRDL